jgi:hypothetical protein
VRQENDSVAVVLFRVHFLAAPPADGRDRSEKLAEGLSGGAAWVMHLLCQYGNNVSLLFSLQCAKSEGQVLGGIYTKLCQNNTGQGLKFWFKKTAASGLERRLRSQKPIPFRR